jgi:serine/threonine protein kinase
MDSRVALCNNYQLRLQNKEGGVILYTINKEIGRGGSCIVYDAEYETNTGDKKLFRIKECYPSKLHIIREETGALRPTTEDMADFDSARERMRSDFSVFNDLYYTDGLADSLVDKIDIYPANNTKYTVSPYSQGKPLSDYRLDELKTCISITKQVAYALCRIHEKGYLYLDVKPDNVLIVKGQHKRAQLFDFDSLIPISAIHARNGFAHGDVRLSYSKGFAAIELQMADLKKLSFHTDVFGIGALLFYMLFGIVPAAPDCKTDARYDFTKLAYAGDNYPDKLFFALTDFFHKSLANYYLDRYKDMQQTILKLEEIEKFSDPTAPFVHSTRLVARDAVFGRTKELSELTKWFERNDNNCLFITGMGGIGKSALMREYLSRNRNRFDAMLYLHHKGSLMRTLTDDFTASINTIEKNDVESLPEYFRRKLACFRKLVSGTNSILVIDDFAGENDQDLVSILDLDWKVVFITRNTPLARGYKVLPIMAIEQEEDLRQLFENRLERRINNQEQSYLNNIITKISGHTLVLELLAKQIASSYLSVSMASELVDKHGFSSIAQEKVTYDKDLVAYQETIGNIIATLFDAGQLSENKKILLKTVSLLGSNGIDINMFQEILKLESKDDINQLIRSGWMELRDATISMHPVVIEVIHRWDWNAEYVASAVQMMEWLYIKIKVEGDKENYPQKLLEIMERTRTQTPKLFKWIERNLEKFGITGKVVRERYIRDSKQASKDNAKLLQYLQLAEEVLDGCKREKSLRKTAIFSNLFLCTLLFMPRYREDYILKEAEELLRASKGINDSSQMNLLSRIVEIHAEKRDFDTAYQIIMKAANVIKRAKWFGRPHIHAKYYEMLSDFYDAKLNGAYEPGDPEEEKCLGELIKAIDKTIFYAKKMGTVNGQQLLAKYFLAKATVLIRSLPEEKEQILKLLVSAQKIVFEHAQPHAQVTYIYYMVWSWYFTLVSPDYLSAVKSMQKALDIPSQTSATDLDAIDNVITPCANILLEWEQFEASAEQIVDGIHLCEKFETVVPYVRKKMELYGYCLDVYHKAQDYERCREIIEKIDHENALHKDMNIVKEIPDELRNEAYNA